MNQSATNPAKPATTPAEAHDEDALDEALRESFPSSDPPALDVHPAPVVPPAAPKKAHA